MFVDSLFSILFIALLFLAFHTYVFYPVIMKAIASFRPPVAGLQNVPPVSILISAFNEEKVIADRIENIAALDYDFTKLELLIGSDQSSDGTNEILLQLKKKYSWLNVFFFDQRRGKAAVLSDLMNSARYELLVFTDANSEFERSAVKRLVQGFADQDVGGVCGRLILRETNQHRFKSIEEKKYWEYETFIKKSEGKCGILIGANGGIFAVRKSLFQSFPPAAVTDDLYITLSVLMKGRKFIYEEDAIASEDLPEELFSEFRRKIRFAATNYQTLAYVKGLFFNRNVLLSFAFWSHKIIRWFFPFILVGLMATNIALRSESEFYSVMLDAQLIFYGIGLIGYLFSLVKIRISIFSGIYFFILSNAALLIGFVRFAQGRQSTIWQSTPR